MQFVHFAVLIKEGLMKGTEQYKNRFVSMIESKIQENKDIEYLNEYKSMLISQKAGGWSGKYNYINMVVRFMRAINKKPEEIKHIDYINYLAGLVEEGKSYSYRVQNYASLRQWCRCLEMCCDGYDKEQSLTRGDSPKKDETHISVNDLKNKKDKYLTPEEIKRYIDNVKNNVGSRVDNVDRDLAIISIFLSTAVRCASLYQLDVDNIDWENKKIYFINKGGEYREAILTETTEKRLKNWMVKREKMLKSKKKENEEALFISTRGNRLARKSIATIVKKYGEGIKDLSPHKLRHTVATNMINATGDINLVREYLGHSKIETTLIYVDDYSEKKIAGSKIMDAMI